MLQYCQNYEDVMFGESCLKETEKYLDSIDILQLINDDHCYELDELRALIEDKFGNNDDIINSDVFDGCVFNWMNNEEFGDYLYKRYGKVINIYDVSKTYIKLNV